MRKRVARCSMRGAFVARRGSAALRAWRSYVKHALEPFIFSDNQGRPPPSHDLLGWILPIHELCQHFLGPKRHVRATPIVLLSAPSPRVCPLVPLSMNHNAPVYQHSLAASSSPARPICHRGHRDGAHGQMGHSRSAGHRHAHHEHHAHGTGGAERAEELEVLVDELQALGRSLHSSTVRLEFALSEAFMRYFSDQTAQVQLRGGRTEVVASEPSFSACKTPGPTLELH